MKNRLKSMIQDESGQILILFAILLTVMLASVGLVVDIGYFYVEKQKMQNSVDASALGGAQELIHNQTKAEQVAKDIAEKNGLTRSKVTVTKDTTKNSVKVNYAEKVQPFFLQIFGVDNIEITASATAQATQETSIFDYVIFSGDKNSQLSIANNNQTVNGKVHINGNMNLTGNNNTFNEQVEVGGSYQNFGNYNVIKRLMRKAPYIEMPVFDINNYKNNATKIYTRNTTFSDNDLNINGVIFVNGDLTISANKIIGNGTIVATGAIYILGNKFEYSSADDFIGLYSLKNIHISGNNTRIEGFFYAPEGTISIYGNGATIKGAVIAKNIDISSNGNQYIFDSKVKNLDTEKVIKLIN